MTEAGKGIFVISLDFELHWGVRSRLSLDQYREHLRGVRQVVPALLDLFAQYGIHATWATVGFMFFDSREQLLSALPARRPAYADPKLSPYPELGTIGLDESCDPFHFAASLLRLIAARPGQEIGTHTFSHYYCLEAGQDLDSFRDDLRAARQAAARLGVSLESLVFPHNQFNRQYLEACRQAGIKAFRGNESSSYYRPRSRKEESLTHRALRLLDSYVSLSSHNCASQEELAHEFPYNIPSSRFLRPYSRLLGILEPLKRRRILGSLRHAARHGKVFHLWWHPENFGTHTRKNLSALESILREYAALRDEYGMESLNMGEIAARWSAAAAARTA
ncbi:MAG TPA: polysaccharide deacetylase family protein [Terriglobales bacterium]|jgi:peptidoglycan/xylan/chitin deacetylase (PgdA/CDA1 family)|nr:polysaccharide deacetylase family protein [Terriglobales bacterium]